MSRQIKIIRYDRSRKKDWDRFIKTSRQRNFIFHRDYLEYHGERFQDFSLMVYSGERLIALLPAERTGNVVSSHRGLSFGGWLTPENHFDVLKMKDIFDFTISFLRNENIEELIYKPVPSPYSVQFADEDKYILFGLGCEICNVELSSVINLENRALMRYSKRNEIEKAVSSGVRIAVSDDLPTFWNILEKRLSEKYNASPVHTLHEIKKLARLFPENIKLYTAFSNNGIMEGGIILYISDTVIKTQYIATTDNGRKTGVLPLLIDSIYKEYADVKSFLDLGSSAGNEPMELNEGLIGNKYGLGGRPIIYPTYRIKII